MNIRALENNNNDKDLNLWNRRGTFSISMPVISTYPEVVMKIMSNCIIVRAEYLFMRECIMYEAYSLLFREVPEGAEAPVYDPTEIFDV